MRTIPRALLGGTTALALLLATAACGSDNGATASTIAVTAKDAACEVSQTDAEAGTITFDVKNEGTKTTEFYVYASGERVMGEVENITTGLSRKLIVELDAGEYETACKPGMKGKGIRGKFTVTGTNTKALDPDLKAAAEEYELYVKEQSDILITETQKFVDTVKAGNIDEAKHLFPISRTYWERIEPVAEIFGDLDPKIDGREADLEEGQEFTGFHRIEKALWTEPDTVGEIGPVADQLMDDVREVVKLIQETDLKPLQLANGSTELLDEIAAPSGKISGEEDIFSGTDVWDMVANLEGSKAAIDALRPYLEKHDKDLLTDVDERFAAAEAVFAKHRVGDGYKLYGELTDEDKKEIVTAINALKEKTSLVAGVISQ